MNDSPQDTRAALMRAAGELFAEYGFDGASTRQIAQRAGTNMASIGYHFNGKENLYLETLRSVLADGCSWGEMLEEAGQRHRDGAPIEAALEAVVRARLTEILGEDHKVWETKLLIRALLEPSPAMQAVTHEVFRPEIQRMLAVIQSWNPDLTEDQAKRWANSLVGQEIVYVLAKTVILDTEGWTAFPPGYFDEVARHIARMMTAALWPEKLL
jgi:AcrR family transcriptional regulator